jgi:YidC/Oxa1 family membrane protein insertase
LTSSVRFNSSTTPAETPSIPPTPADNPFATPEKYDFIVDESSAIEPHIGWLHEVGVNFGWGPTSTMQWVFEHIHVWSGMPYWASIFTTAIVVRGALMWFNLRAADASARFQAIRPEWSKLTEKFQEQQKLGDRKAAMEARQEMQSLKKFADVKFNRMFMPIVVQGVLGFGMFKLMRRMAELKVPGMEQGGFDWISDLTVPDPAWIVPVALTATMHMTMRVRIYQDSRHGQAQWN